MAARYQQTGEWRHRASCTGRNDDDDLKWAIVVEQSDLMDLRTRFVYSGGTFRVRVTNVPGWRTKTFHGEVAHHEARRYASDVAAAVGHWQWWPDL